MHFTAWVETWQPWGLEVRGLPEPSPPGSSSLASPCLCDLEQVTAPLRAPVPSWLRPDTALKELRVEGGEGPHDRFRAVRATQSNTGRREHSFGGGDVLPEEDSCRGFGEELPAGREGGRERTFLSQKHLWGTGWRSPEQRVEGERQVMGSEVGCRGVLLRAGS